MRSLCGPVRSQYGPRWAKTGQQKAETEQILDIRETGQSRGADFGGGNQVPINGPWPPPRCYVIWRCNLLGILKLWSCELLEL